MIFVFDLLHSMTTSRSIHVAANDIILFFFMAEQYSIVYMYYIFFIHSSADGHLGCFYVLASALLTTPKPLTVEITTNCGKFFKRWEYQTTLPLPEKPVCRSRSNSQNCTLNNRLVSNWETSYVKGVYSHPAYLTYMQSISYEMPGQMKHKLESRWLGEISITSDMQMTPSLWQKVKRN